MKKLFKDPDEKYVISIPAEWKYAGIDKCNIKLHQFEISSGCFFQISRNEFTERVNSLIIENKIIPHDFDLPNKSFVEKYYELNDRSIYSWMAVIDDSFFHAVYFFDKKTKNSQEIGLELMDIRFALQNISINRKDDCKARPSDLNKEKVEFSDIEYWKDETSKFLENLSEKGKFKTEMKSALKIDAVKLYALLVTKISQQPNGFFALSKIKKPLDNPIWWDFVLECEKGFIQIWRTPFVIEAQYSFDGIFDLEVFFNSNIERYKNEIENTIKTFDRHTIYINHYQSYKQCVNTLWKEILEVKLDLPKAAVGHRTTKAEMDKYVSDLHIFKENSIKYHALAKSLVLNAAFKIESFLNLIIRIGSIPEVKNYPDVLTRFTKQDFASRIKSIRFYTQILSNDIDMGSAIYRDAKELMTLRNKYVHYEEDAIHNKIGEIYYDRDYPLNPVDEHRPAIEAIRKTFHNPDFDTVKKAFETSNKFVNMMVDLFDKDFKKDLLLLIEENPIGYNETKGIYSSVFMPIALDFFGT